MSETIEPFIHRRVVVLRENASAYEASRAMTENRIGSVVVSDGDGRITGIVTDRDLACCILGMNLSPDTEISEIMTRELVHVTESASVEDVIHLMKDRGIRRIPVLHKTRTEHCIGMISLDDLVVAQMISIEDVSEIVRAQVLRRRKRSPDWRGQDLHGEKSTDRFLRLFEERSGLSEARALSVLSLVLGMIVRRIHFTSASDLIALLPERLRSELLDLPAGPDRSINGDAIVRELALRFDIDGEQAHHWLMAMWESLGEAIPAVTEADLADELPDDIRVLFVDLPEGALTDELALSRSQDRRQDGR